MNKETLKDALALLLGYLFLATMAYFGMAISAQDTYPTIAFSAYMIGIAHLAIGVWLFNKGEEES